MTVIALAGGSGIFAAFLVVMVFGVAWTLYTKSGSAITERPYFNQYGGAPGAQAARGEAALRRDAARAALVGDQM